MASNASLSPPREVIFNFDFEYHRSLMCIEQLRSYSFRNSSTAYNVSSLVRNGLYKTKNDIIACAFCDYQRGFGPDPKTLNEAVKEHNDKHCAAGVENITRFKTPFFAEYLANVAYLHAYDSMSKNKNHPLSMSRPVDNSCGSEADIRARQLNSEFCKAVLRELPEGYVKNTGNDSARYPFIRENKSMFARPGFGESLFARPPGFGQYNNGGDGKFGSWLGGERPGSFGERRPIVNEEETFGPRNVSVGSFGERRPTINEKETFGPTDTTPPTNDVGTSPENVEDTPPTNDVDTSPEPTDGRAFGTDMKAARAPCFGDSSCASRKFFRYSD